jgi:hypothetical protein
MTLLLNHDVEWHSITFKIEHKPPSPHDDLDALPSYDFFAFSVVFCSVETVFTLILKLDPFSYIYMDMFGQSICFDLDMHCLQDMQRGPE